MILPPQKAPQTAPTRFAVRAPLSDRALLRALARRLSDGGPEAAHARTTLERLLAVELSASTCDGILAALRRSPLVGADLDLTRARIL